MYRALLPALDFHVLDSKVPVKYAEFKPQCVRGGSKNMFAICKPCEYLPCDYIKVPAPTLGLFEVKMRARSYENICSETTN